MGLVITSVSLCWGHNYLHYIVLSSEIELLPPKGEGDDWEGWDLLAVNHVLKDKSTNQNDRTPMSFQYIKCK